MIRCLNSERTIHPTSMMYNMCIMLIGIAGLDESQIFLFPCPLLYFNHYPLNGNLQEIPATYTLAETTESQKLCRLQY